MYCSIKELIADLSTKNPDKMVLSKLWDTEDVHEVLHDTGEPSISQYQAHKVLKLVDRTHDANIGINWDTLRCAVDRIIDDTQKQPTTDTTCFTVPRSLSSVDNSDSIPSGLVTVEFDSFELRAIQAASIASEGKQHPLSGFIKAVADEEATPEYLWSVFAECCNGKCTISLQNNFRKTEYRWIESIPN